LKATDLTDWKKLYKDSDCFAKKDQEKGEAQEHTQEAGNCQYGTGRGRRMRNACKGENSKKVEMVRERTPKRPWSTLVVSVMTGGRSLHSAATSGDST
jgi:hypothetical protein